MPDAGMARVDASLVAPATATTTIVTAATALAPILTTAPASTTPPIPSMDPDQTDPPTGGGGTSEVPVGPIGLTAAEDCELENEFITDNTGCTVDQTCNGSWASHIDCRLGIDATWYCQCQTPQNAWTATLIGSGLQDVCQGTLDICRSDASLGEAECVPQGGAADSNGCFASKTCTYERDFESGIAARIQVPSVSACQAVYPDTDSTDWRCTCEESGLLYADYYIQASNPPLDTCARADALCARFDTFTPARGIECEVISETYASDSCANSSTCRVPGTIDGVEVFIDSTLDVSCSTTQAGEWFCYVGGPRGTNMLNIPAPEAPHEACRDVVDAELAAINDTDPPSTTDLDAGATASGTNDAATDASP